jgi:hypothetical protein
MVRGIHFLLDFPSADHPRILPAQPCSPSLSQPDPGAPLPLAHKQDSGRPALPFPPMPGGTSGRCSVKGCIFPSAGQGGDQCRHHLLAEQEPKFFLSMQPSILLLDQAKFGIPDQDYEDPRARDRRRLAALREKFREEVA